MGYLFAAIVCSAAIALLFKYSETREYNRYAVTTANYLVAVAVSGMAFVRGNQATGDVTTTLWLGFAAGVLFFAGFLMFQISIRHNGAGLTGSFAKLGVLVPMTASLIWWRELPELMQWFGIGLSLGAVGLACMPKNGGDNARLRLLLPLVLLVIGCAEFSNKIFQKLGRPDQTALFLAVAFGTAFLCSLVTTLGKRRRFRWHDIGLGCLVGIPNLFSSWFLIEALGVLPAAVVFPAFSAGSIVLIILGSATLYGERLDQRDRWTVLLVLPALLLVNL